MRAVTISEPGSPDVLGWAEVPDPVCGPGEVIVDVAATAVNRADLLQRQGFYPPPPGASDILGLECSGIVSEVGEGVLGWSVASYSMPNLHVSEAVRYVPLALAGVLIVLFSLEHIVAIARGEEVEPSWN